MKPFVPVLVMLFTAGLACAQGHEHGPGDGQAHGPADGHDHGPPAGASPSPGANLPPPGPEESAALEKIAALKQTQPKDAAEEASLRNRYAEALGDFVVGFPESPRASFALEAALKLLVGAGEANRAETLAKMFLEKAQKLETKALARRQLLQVLKFGGQTDRAVAFALEQSRTNTEAPDTEWYVFEAASIEVDRGNHAAGIKILEDFLAANPKHIARNKLTLRIVDFMISAGRTTEAIARLEAFLKDSPPPEDKALATYLTGVAYLAASRQATGDAATTLRMQAREALEPLMAAARKDAKANRPYGGMAFTTAADIALATGDLTAAGKVYTEMAELFRGTPEGGFADRSRIAISFIGSPLEGVEGPDVNGKTVKSTDFKGKILLVDFFSATFGDYPRILATQKRLQRRLSGKPFAILGVNLDRKELAEPVKRFMLSVAIDWPVILDGSGFEGPIARTHNITVMPANFIVDENGVVLRVNLSGPHLDDLIAQEVARVEKGLPSTYKPGAKAAASGASPSPAAASPSPAAK